MAAGPQPPQWLVHEVQHRVVLLLNHVLMQEPEARARLVKVQGQVVRLQWRDLNLQLAPSPAGLFERRPSATPNLVLTIAENSPLAIAQAAARGDRPALRIEGDVQLASEVNWLIDHVRWDIEEDLSRLIGDAGAHTLAGVARTLAAGLRQLMPSRAGAAPRSGP